MWLRPKFDRRSVSIGIWPDRLVCALFTARKNHAYLIDYLSIELQKTDIINGIIFNSTRIIAYIHDFLAKHHAHRACISLSLADTTIIQNIRTHTHSAPDCKELNATIEKRDRYFWHYHYLYPTDDGSFAFYLHGIPKILLMQCHLLARRGRLNVTRIVTAHAALLELFYLLHKNNRHHSLLKDRLESDPTLATLITALDLQTTLIYENSLIPDLEKERSYLTHALALHKGSIE